MVRVAEVRLQSCCPQATVAWVQRTDGWKWRLNHLDWGENGFLLAQRAAVVDKRRKPLTSRQELYLLVILSQQIVCSSVFTVQVFPEHFHFQGGYILPVWMSSLCTLTPDCLARQSPLADEAVTAPFYESPRKFYCSLEESFWCIVTFFCVVCACMYMCICLHVKVANRKWSLWPYKFHLFYGIKEVWQLADFWHSLSPLLIEIGSQPIWIIPSLSVTLWFLNIFWQSRFLNNSWAVRWHGPGLGSWRRSEWEENVTSWSIP